MISKLGFRTNSLAVLAASILAFTSASAHAEGYLQPFMDGQNNLHRNIDGSDIDAFATTMREAGRIIVDIEMENVATCTVLLKRCLRFHLVTAPNSANRKWDVIAGVEADEYDARWKANVDRDLRPTDIERLRKLVSNASGRGGDQKEFFAGLWIDNEEKLAWASYRNIAATNFDEEVKKRVTNGKMVLVDVEQRGQEFSAIFVRPRADRTVNRWRPTKAEYDDQSQSIFGDKMLWPLYFLPGARHDMSLVRDERREARVFSALNDQQLVGQLTTARRDGYQLVDIERNGNDKWIAIFLRPVAE